MKINPISNPNILQSYKTSKAAPKPITESLGGADEVSFSSGALEFSKIMARAKDQLNVSQPTSAPRMDEIKAAIAQGTYRVDSEKIADSILGVMPEE